MKRLHSILVLALPLASCLRPPAVLPARYEEDLSITFPAFFAQPSISLDTEGTVYELDGDTLRALSIATQDLLPPQDKALPCGSRLESQRYRVVRQGELFFIRVDEDPKACGRAHPALDSGASYAIHRDGRILRRLMDGAADVTSPSGSGGNSTSGAPGTASPGSLGEGPSPFLPPSWQDAGVPVPVPEP
ncbi:hypothetical protein OV207_02105 [Corallococcus sp. BB11-1]|uniref:hypothetical protein n=1 Tax=Corallococcus sp. BB11-1 TaxID=2996783 RepID=UPI0010D63C14|nr:hypothetical protein [Corallococcus sp. BB11-1]MCY1030233.1 hypothetical protein [Corallococcus sp. BB11-1]RYZ17852.1 MAG: hypothetical protein EOO70_00730 [Myxococcaceae bacterium]